MEEHKLDLTFFEVCTMLAFLKFRDAGVNVAVIECGIGGRIDATNICKSKVGVITSIGYDHCEVLGETLEEICTEKSGIIKPGMEHIVIGKTVLRDIVESKCQQTGTELTLVSRDDYRESNTEIARRVAELYTGKAISLEQVSEEQPCRFQ